MPRFPRSVLLLPLLPFFYLINPLLLLVTSHSSIVTVEDTDKPLTPILCRVKKVDSPSKHVSFKDRDSNALHFRDKNLGAEYDKRAELRERLEKAKLRAVQLRNAELESKLRSNRLLNIR